MAEQGQPILQALDRTRRRWLLSAMINAGGRWAVLPATLIACAGMALVLAGPPAWYWLALLAVGALAAVAGTLGLTLRAYARPGAAGAPDYALLLDRALGLGDALPAYLESTGPFKIALERKIKGGLDGRREKAAAPVRHFGPLLVALILALMPLALSQLDREAPPPDTIADAASQPEQSPQPASGSSGQGSGESGSSEAEAEDATPDEGSGGGGDEGRVPGAPDGGKAEGGAGEAPPESKPQPKPDGQTPDSGGTGDQQGKPEAPEPPKDPDIKNDFDKIRPEATDGDTAKTDRSRWIYNPDARPLEGATPNAPDMKGGGERPIDRTKVTARERKLIDDLYRKLFE